jgi:hypothetical protein
MCVCVCVCDVVLWCWLQICELLRSYGIDEIYENIGRTGVVAMIHGALPGPCVGECSPHVQYNILLLITILLFSLNSTPFVSLQPCAPTWMPFPSPRQLKLTIGLKT